jgi:hypothetical protein
VIITALEVLVGLVSLAVQAAKGTGEVVEALHGPMMW